MKTLSCRRAEELIPLHAAGDLPAGRRGRAVAAHVAACQACGRLAEEFRASREWARGAGAVPEFGEEFYEQLRAGVLEQIRRDDRPPASRRVPFFAALSGRRLAYAASFALAVVAFALALNFYLGRDAHAPQQQNQLVVAPPPVDLIDPPRHKPADARPTPAAQHKPATLQATHGPARNNRHDAPPKNKWAGGNFIKRPPSLRSAPPRDATRAPEVALVATAVAPETGNGAQPESAARAEVAQVSRIEIQTADPNIRIIWLAPGKGGEAEPAEADPRR